MRFLSKIIVFPFFVCCLLFIVPIPVHAAGEFELSYKTLYNITNSGKTEVSQDVVLKNKTDNYYADKFELKIGSTKVQNVKASDETGTLETNVNFDNNITTISVKFKQRVIGRDKTMPWKLSYESSELATKSGQIWEISIPRLAKSDDIGTYEATIRVPRPFGPVAFAVPQPLTNIQTGQGQEFTFNKNQLLASGIAMSLGEKQVFSFKLLYYLENPNVTAQSSTITLPPDNNYQKIVLEKLDPKPEDVTVDGDGNFIARYKLKPKQKIEITAQGYVEVFSKPFRNIFKELTKEEKEPYLQPQPYWETDNAFIKEKATELKTPQKIYEYVTTYLSYSYEKLNQPKIDRKGAVAAYTSSKDSVCMEFTDLFIAIARSAGIPSREVNGYAYTQNERLRPLSLSLNAGDILHAWPEYWDDKLGWVQIDPTWGSTSGGLDYFNKLDFNHVTLVQRGISSSKPFPAGSFKPEDKQSEKTVFVEFAKELPNATSTPVLTLDVSDKMYSGIPLKATAELHNTGSTSIIGQKLELQAQKIKVNSQNPFFVPVLPPFASKTYIFDLESPEVLGDSQDILVLNYAQSQVTKPIKIEPLYKIVLTQIFLITLTGSVLIITLGLTLYKKFMHKSSKIL